MIFIYHKDDKVIRTENASGYVGWNVAKALVELAKTHPEEILVWCDERLEGNLNVSVLPELMHHKRLLYSFDASGRNYIDPIVGFAEESSPFLRVKREVKYPTWQMSGNVGMVHAAAVIASEPYLNVNDNFDYFLNSFAKRAMIAGLFCYSHPKLLKGDFPKIEWKHADTYETFRFVRQHYRMRWITLLLLNLILFKKNYAVLPYVRSFFYANRKFNEKSFANISIESARNVISEGTIDVMIPTIGRREHFHNVMKDLSAQTFLPKRVIVVEQNPLEGSVSELDFLKTETWPFEIDHVFTHRSGACAARNVGLMKVESEFVFMADDDIRFGPTLIEDVFGYLRKTGNEIIQVSGPQHNETVGFSEVIQHAVFSSGLAFVKRDALDGVWFSPGFEFGYGEDKDFGIQLRNKGHDVIYVPSLRVLHLKAPIGGFRLKPKLQWNDDKPAPKPSPTVMLYMIRNMTNEQVKGYKVVHFFKNYGKNGNINPFSAYRNFKKRWQKSVYWANELAKR
ncbi:MAG: glycosyltransferase family 2 protein [Flavobacterium sp.]|uniref:glycosyltransferase family 2 protein n=1 Tax=Flavobacterium sp. TaxID=239 RepID=UPI0012096FEE|nr:glycosyltransferase family A protein [Flavobacterium sp.]RZJ66088.1 MAG: glycosyltransferase family 2 protein [Flavobacterium sp.]